MVDFDALNKKLRAEREARKQEKQEQQLREELEKLGIDPDLHVLPVGLGYVLKENGKYLTADIIQGGEKVAELGRINTRAFKGNPGAQEAWIKFMTQIFINTLGPSLGLEEGTAVLVKEVRNGDLGAQPDPGADGLRDDGPEGNGSPN